MHLYVYRITLNPIHGGLDVQMLGRYKEYRKARYEGSHAYTFI